MVIEGQGLRISQAAEHEILYTVSSFQTHGA